ncbi:uncharacterized protein LOC100878955 isoform X2 [Megachile rotundata]|uniref:uncharacterized protein LOC100878955 isoform X2 n=1 Tax=Megachile rotundata TaxID=143995 RepID=UPI0006149C97|nr:PREDICTED: uncharacterized protein LOC100878955 isoform X1 [Megachile rotundata]
MYRLGYLALFAAVAVLGNASYDVCRKCNRSYSEMLERQRVLHSRVLPSAAQFISYLPEEDYIEEREQAEQQSFNRNNRNLLPEYRSLCETVTKKVQLDDSDYEYQPPHYHEIYCKSYSLLDNIQQPVSLSKQKCVEPNFHCVQRSRRLLLMRRRWDEECWEPFSKQIASGCDCMWPVSILGDITDHY